MAKKSMLKSLTSLIIALLMICTIVPAQAADVDPRPRSGDIGDNIHWEISKRVLTVTGTGAIPDYVDSDFVLQQGVGFPETAPPWYDLTWHHYYNDWIYVDKIVIGEGITTIGDFAFARMRENELVLPDSLVEVKTNSFFDNSYLKSIVLPPNLKKLGLGAFSGEYSCTSIQLNDKLEVIGRAAFDGCQKVQSVYIPDSVTTLGQEAFRNCYGLEQVRLSENLTEIPTWAFVHTGLKNLEIPAAVELIDYQSFGDIKALESVTFKEGSRLKAFGKFVFFDAVALTDIVLPDTLETMDTGVFDGCSALETIEIPASVTSLGNLTFKKCSKLTSVTLHEGIPSIGDSTFEECVALPEITIPGTVTSIAQKAFLNCAALPKIDIPASVTSIGTSAFESCGILAEVGLTDGLQTIGNSAFKNCASLSEIEIPDTVTSIGASAFNGCTSIPEITIPGSVTSLGNSAFSGCSSLASATLEYGLKTIGTGVFQNCTALKTVIIPDTASWATRGTLFAFSGCSALETAIIVSDPENVNEENIASLVGKLGTAANWPNGTMNATVYIMKNSDAGLTPADNDYAVPVNAPAGLRFDGWKTAIDGTGEADYTADRVVYALYSGNALFEFVSKNLALDSALAFKFYGFLYDENPAEDAYMEFSIGDIRTVNVPLNNASLDDKGRYVFTCYLNVLEVDEKIGAIFHDGEVTVERQNPLSVTDYLDQVLEKHQNGTEEDAKVINLINAISNYAHYAQLALDETHEEYTVGEGGKYHATEARTDITLYTVGELAPFAAVKTVSADYTDIKKTTRALILDDETAIVLIITPEDPANCPNIKVTNKNGSNVSFECERQANGSYKVVIRGIAAHRLGDTYKIDIDNGGVTYTNLSALSYAYSVLGSSMSDAYKQAVSALYDYYTATAAYMG